MLIYARHCRQDRFSDGVATLSVGKSRTGRKDRHLRKEEEEEEEEEGGAQLVAI